MTTKIHLIASNTADSLEFSLSPGHASDHTEGIKLLGHTPLARRTRVVMDRAYCSHVMRHIIRLKGCVPVVPPKSDIKKPWRYDRELYKRRNEIERLFHHLKNFRRVATRYDKLDTSYRAFVALGLSMLMLKTVV